MYIKNTTNNVIKLIEELEIKDDLNKLKFLIYIFGLLNNNQINEDNESNPNLIDKDIKIFTLDIVGLSYNACTILLEYFVMLYNNLINAKNAYIDNTNVIGVIYDKDDKTLISKFESLDFNEKLDVFSEIIIRYDNETYFKDKITILTFDSKSNGFDIAKIIQEYKN